MKDILELYVYLSAEEREILMHEYKDKGALKFALSRLLDKEIRKHCEQLTLSEKWVLRNSVPETDESEAI